MTKAILYLVVLTFSGIAAGGGAWLADGYTAESSFVYDFSDPYDNSDNDDQGDELIPASCFSAELLCQQIVVLTTAVFPDNPFLCESIRAPPVSF